MKRMDGSRPFDVERNMSYTNLAAMASSFETSARLVPAGGATRTGGSQAQLETIYAKAQELINTGCASSRPNASIQRATMTCPCPYACVQAADGPDEPARGSRVLPGRCQPAVAGALDSPAIARKHP